jgi:1-acyl-sn-glycerol-3-phosphate acyltransferase
MTLRGALKPRYSELVFRSFELGFDRWRARRLRYAPIVGLPHSLPRDRPLVMVANHTSWWDGFLLRDIHRRLRPGAPMYSVMHGSELRRHPFLRWLGGLPLEPGSLGSTRALLRTLVSNVAEKPDASIIYFPQGSIWPAWRRPLGFRRGVETLIRALDECYVLPIGIHVESLNHLAPTVFRAAGPLHSVPEQAVSAAQLEQHVTEALDAMQGIIAAEGEAAPARIGRRRERTIGSGGPGWSR